MAATAVRLLATRGSHVQDPRCSPPATLRVPYRLQLRPIKGCTKSPGCWPITQTPNTANPADMPYKPPCKPSYKAAADSRAPCSEA